MEHNHGSEHPVILFLLFIFFVVGAVWAGWRSHVAKQKRLVRGRPQLEGFKLPAADDPRWANNALGGYSLGKFSVHQNDGDWSVWYAQTKVGNWEFYTETVGYEVEARARREAQAEANQAAEALRAA